MKRFSPTAKQTTDIGTFYHPLTRIDESLRHTCCSCREKDWKTQQQTPDSPFKQIVWEKGEEG